MCEREILTSASSELRKYSMGALIQKYAANKQFFTDEEFRMHYGEIMIVSCALRKFDEMIEKVTEIK